MKKCLFIILALTLCSCSSASKNTPQTGADIDKLKGNSLFYYLVSNFKGLQGDEQSSQFYLNKAFKKDSHSTHLKLQRAYQLARENKFIEAKKLADSAVKQSDTNPEAHLLLGKIAISLGQIDEAQKHLNQAIKLDSKNDEAYMILSRSYSSQNENDKAIQVMQQLIKASPESTRAYYFLANLYATEKKDFNAALKQYENILNYDPDDFKAWQLVAEIHLAQKNYKLALEAFKRVIEINPLDLNTQVRIALLYFELNDKDHAIESFEAILHDNPEADKIQYYLGLLYLDKENFEAALNSFGQIGESSSFYEDAISRRIAVLIRQEKGEEALALAQKALKKNSRKKGFYELLASVQAIQSDFDGALDTLKEGLKVAPKNEDLLFSQAVLFEKIGQWEKSIEVMREVLEVSPENAQALNFIGYTYADKGQNLDEAQSFVEQALKFKPDDGYVIDSLGWVYFKKGNLPKATSLLMRANKLAPNEPAILEHLGDLFTQVGDKRKARTHFEKALFILKERSKKIKKDEEQIEIIRQKISGL